MTSSPHTQTPDRRLRLVGPHELELKLRSDPGEVARARHAVARVGRRVGFDHFEIGAVELAVGEACSNVVHHAYPHAAGAMHIHAAADAEQLVVTVSDEGQGIRPCVQRARAGLGMTIMLALCDRLEVQAGEGGRGTRVAMTFGL